MYLPRTLTRAIYQLPRKRFLSNHTIANVSLSDTLTITQTIDSDVYSTQSLSSSLILTSSFTTNNIFNRLLSDTLTLIDTISPNYVSQYTVNDSLSLTQMNTLQSILNLASLNILALNSSLTSENLLNISITQTLTFTETVIHRDQNDYLLSDFLSLTDTVTYNIDAGFTFSNSLTFLTSTEYNLVTSYDILHTLPITDSFTTSHQITISQSLSLTSTVDHNEILFRSLDDSLSLIDSIGEVQLLTQFITLTQTISLNQAFSLVLSQFLVFAQTISVEKFLLRTVSQSLTFIQHVRAVPVYKIIHTLSLTDDLTGARQYPFTDHLTLTQSILDNNILGRRYLDRLNPQQIIHTNNTLRLVFETNNQILSLPECVLFKVYPYNNLDLPIYGLHDLSFFDETDYTRVTFFEVFYTLPYSERQAINRYFSYWHNNKFNIKIQDDLWLGYLTLDNSDLLQSQFKNDYTNFSLRFEAIPVSFANS